MRLDQYIAAHYKFTRNKAQALIDAGLVSVNQKIVNKSSFEVIGDETISIKEDKSVHWVSRSAGKLDGFLDEIGYTAIIGKRCLDIGSSTGWFTQVLLMRWATHVDAVDVGTDQLHQSLREDSRVVSYEKQDIRKFNTNASGATGTYDIIVCDVSFISLENMVDEFLRFSDMRTDMFILFKPQFEVWRENLRKTGVPKDEKSIEYAIAKFEQLLNHKCLKIVKKSISTVIGEAGNKEWMFYLKRSTVSEAQWV